MARSSKLSAVDWPAGELPNQPPRVD